jgi:hypothetical protein
MTYKKLQGQGADVDIDYGSPTTNHLYRLLISNLNQGMMARSIADNKLELIKNYSIVIIYGAGVVARDVLAFLDKSQIGILGFAVSKKENNPKNIMGNKIYCIDDLVQYREEAIVLIAVTEKYQKEILEKLTDMKFNNIIAIH